MNQNLIRQPFTPTRLEEERAKDKFEAFTVKINREEREELDYWKKLIQQPKDSTALKQLARIGANVLQDQKIKVILDISLNNYRKNKRLDIVDFD